MNSQFLLLLLCTLLCTSSLVSSFAISAPHASSGFLSPHHSLQRSLSSESTQFPQFQTLLFASTPQSPSRSSPLKSSAPFIATAILASLSIHSLFPSPAFAATLTKSTLPLAATAKLHIGEKLASNLRSTGLPDYAILLLISAMPVVELRGAIPVGIWMGMPLTQLLPICVLGNMLPIIPLLFALKSPVIQKLFSPILKKAASKSKDIKGTQNQLWMALATFVGVPLPGTGAWTGAFASFLLGMSIRDSITSIAAGVLTAGGIMSAITYSGKKGGAVALAVLGTLFLRSRLTKDDFN